MSIVVSTYGEMKSIPGVPTLFGGIMGALLSPFFASIVDLTDNQNWKSSQRKLERKEELKKDTPIRISFAYLFRIKVDGKYFLVRNNHSKKYQPVGGAYKFDEIEANYLSEHIPVENDNRIPVNEITKRDYRLIVKNHQLRKFVKRFNRTTHRENINDVSREFIEELIKPGILEKKSFGDLSYRYCGRHMTPITYGKIFSNYELLFADIIDVQLSEKQEELFRALMEKENDYYCFASVEEIESLGVVCGKNKFTDDIANHTPKILSANAEELTMKNSYKETITVKL
ncbi:hypothetical protein E0T48_001110 [Enterococcus faecalis]|nr:hypothetical protein [Enterococcus faecalis]EGO8249020.1 hypothetical protein [Enterococcus faecalis]EHK9980872.1 hypothetical protein [Enterococcus faecalis]EKE3416549.1 hypothetical protein [Enterococcus faecalis]EKJ5025761.1 hypothetical protein [Enterococcus faecalis]